MALARAVVAEPSLLLADEPTGNLDSATGLMVMDLLFEIRAQLGTTLLLITHDKTLAARCERQRVAVARALANSPRLLLADEPTGNLDPATSQTVFEALHDLVKRTGVAALIATHNMELAGHMDRVFALKDGHLEERPAESQTY